MKIDNKKFKLHNIQIEPYKDGKVKSIDDIMYLYYTITISSKKKVVEFNVYDFPNIQNLKVLYEDVEEQTPANLNDTLHSSNYLMSPFGTECSIRLSKFVTEDLEQYTLHFYENFGSSVAFDYLEKEELLELIKYTENKLQKGIDKYNKKRRLR